jgi:hypothetical protein
VKYAAVPGDHNPGPVAKDALLTALGEHEVRIIELVEMLGKKGIMTESNGTTP